jgi:hypothetical protein
LSSLVWHAPTPTPLTYAPLLLPSPSTSPQSDRDSKEEIAKVFALFDHEGSGKISFRDLKRVINELGENISEDEMKEMIEEADRDGDGERGDRGKGE